MVRQKLKYRIAFKYCGSCNPYINLTGITRHLVDLVAKQDDLTVVPISAKDVSIIIILCGCYRACGNKEDIRNRAGKYLVVAGESIMGEYVPEPSLMDTIGAKLQEILEKLRDNPTSKQ